MLRVVQRFLTRTVFAIGLIFMIKWVVSGSNTVTPPGEITHPAFLERIARKVPLGSNPLDARSYPFLQTRFNREETRDIFGDRIRAGIVDFWARFQRPFSLNSETVHLDEEMVRGAMEDLMGFNGWMTASCESIKRPMEALGEDEEDWSDLTRQQSLYYIALVVHDAGHFLVDQLAIIVQLSKRLGPSSIFVSLVDYGSDDSTPFISDMMEAVLVLLGIPFRIQRVPPMTSDPSASYYPLEEAYGRNLALEPLLELSTRRKIRFRRVIWLKGFNCPRDILVTLRISILNDAAMVCGVDWKEQQEAVVFNDRWRTRDMDGNLFRGSNASSTPEQVPPQEAVAAQQYLRHLPFQVFCCESGTHVVDPHKSYYQGIGYTSSSGNLLNSSASQETRSARWGEGACMDSSQAHFCRDLWMVAFRKGVELEAERFAELEKEGRMEHSDPLMQQLVTSLRRPSESHSHPHVPNSGDYLQDETRIPAGKTKAPKAKVAAKDTAGSEETRDGGTRGETKMIAAELDATGIEISQPWDPAEFEDTDGSLLFDIGGAPPIPDYQSPHQPIRNKPKRPADARVNLVAQLPKLHDLDNLLDSDLDLEIPLPPPSIYTETLPEESLSLEAQLLALEKPPSIKTPFKIAVAPLGPELERTGGDPEVNHHAKKKGPTKPFVVPLNWGPDQDAPEPVLAGRPPKPKPRARVVQPGRIPPELRTEQPSYPYDVPNQDEEDLDDLESGDDDDFGMFDESPAEILVETDPKPEDAAPHKIRVKRSLVPRALGAAKAEVESEAERIGQDARPAEIGTKPVEPRRPRSLPNSAFDYAIARIIINPRCVTTYAGVSQVQLADDLFGTGEGQSHDVEQDVLKEWRTAPESFVCQEMRSTGGKAQNCGAV